LKFEYLLLFILFILNSTVLFRYLLVYIHETFSFVPGVFGAHSTVLFQYLLVYIHGNLFLLCLVFLELTVRLQVWALPLGRNHDGKFA
jgi:hypothetical protein